MVLQIHSEPYGKQDGGCYYGEHDKINLLRIRGSHRKTYSSRFSKARYIKQGQLVQWLDRENEKLEQP